MYDGLTYDILRRVVLLAGKAVSGVMQPPVGLHQEFLINPSMELKSINILK